MKTIINIKSDRDIKEKAQKIAKNLGLPLSTLINAYLRQLIRNEEIHFSTAPMMTKELEETITIAMQDLKAKKNVSPTFSSKKVMNDYLDSL
ncbi:type II toxin-antitoxin system RelB/DinJ family antitoxin [Patescibacteria group bacterium]|nr:type II toxin-antitoxin system RelB/DinJ family antitoxin [Patescibacteria group bacterium]